MQLSLVYMIAEFMSRPSGLFGKPRNGRRLRPLDAASGGFPGFCGGRPSRPGPGGPGRGLEAAGHIEYVFRVDFDVAFVGAGLSALE